ncbi:hypothetical protein AN219_11245 [Streptomyces nanshensis]|nr:hypothetical protein AN219_11245 [Streptomyces nanshensis]
MFLSRPGADHDDDPAPDAESAARTSVAAGALVRWGAFSCALTPVTLVTCGVSFLAALGAAAGLAVVTAVCGVLLHLSQHAYAQHGLRRFTDGRPGPHRGRHSRTGTGLHRGGRHWGHPGEP